MRASIELSQRLPAIRIPLREKDPDAKLDLQALIDQVYINGAYDMIDYTRPPVPPLEGLELMWTEQLLRKRA